MGIDPGLTRMGYGIVDGSGSRLSWLSSGVLATPREGRTAQRLARLFDDLSALISDFRPEVIAVERVFFKLNARTAVPVIQASGVALVAAARSGVSVYEYSPAEVKDAVVGVGSATKDQVRFMVGRILSIPDAPVSPDAADALGLAICHLHSRRMREVAEGAS